MFKNDKTPVAAGACHCVEPCTCCDCKSNTTRPLMGIALKTLLNRYIADLRTYGMESGDKITKEMVDCGEHLLIEGDRRQGGNYDRFY